ncbi:hypothetical protein V6N13_002258 [Hibiscus sabdariffa]|uniref:Uncharacterized protein n=2 Tax=Hibiscus sabdariffa TaxID=183260 RepID=A0ABR2C3T6_9ROSI
MMVDSVLQVTKEAYAKAAIPHPNCRSLTSQCYFNLYTGISQAPSAAEMEGPAIAATSSAAAGFKAGFFVILGFWYWGCSEMPG